MSIVSLLIILWSFLLSTIAAFCILTWRNNKSHSRWTALLVNAMILTAAAMILYKYDTLVFHKQTDGIFGSLGITVLLFFIPINSWVTFFLIEVKRKGLSPL